jgi:hypothetical protein
MFLLLLAHVFYKHDVQNENLLELLTDLQNAILRFVLTMFWKQKCAGKVALLDHDNPFVSG